MQRFYGGNPDSWLRVPMPLLRAYIDALPGLKAEEIYELSHGVALGGGRLSDEGRRRIVGYLDRAIRQSAGPDSRAAAMPTKDEWEAQMAALGFMTGGDDDDPE